MLRSLFMQAAAHIVKTFPSSKKHQLDKLCAKWLVDAKRPLTLPEKDNGFRKLLQEATNGQYCPPSYKTVYSVCGRQIKD